MAFTPSSTIYLCNVPIDNTYKHQLYFETRTLQYTYFANRIVKTFSNYLTVRKTLPNGSMQSSVKVDCNIDDLYNCNYMYYQNANHGTRYFFAFITNLIYINEGTTEIVFETDVYQTWFLDCDILPSYVEREHIGMDEPGANLVPEPFTFEDYKFKSIGQYPEENEWGYLIVCNEQIGDDTQARGRLHSGIYQGLYFYFYKTAEEINNLLNMVDEEGKEGVVESITLIPSIIPNGIGLLDPTTTPKNFTKAYTINPLNYDFDGYQPVNGKLYTAPFMKLIITNHSGNEAEYNIEYFNQDAHESIHTKAFSFSGDISISPSFTIYPRFYKGVNENIDAGISIKSFPQCSVVSDTFKLWLAKNQFGVALDLATGVGQMVAGTALAVGTGGLAAVGGGGAIFNGASQTLNTIKSIYTASKEPNRTTAGAPNNNLLTAMGKNCFDFYIRTIRGDHARTIDDFFTMYGYQTNKIKIPNLHNRQSFNYVKTTDIAIKGAIPHDDMNILKRVFDNGITLWHSPNVGDYSQSNTII